MNPVFRFGRFAALIVIVILMGVSLTISYQRIIELQERVAQEVNYNAWATGQAEFELARFRHSLVGFVLGDGLVTRDDMIERLDVFWSRLPILLEGPETRAIRKIHELPERVEAIIERLKEVDSLIADLKRGDAETLEQLEGWLQPMEKLLHDIVLEVHSGEGWLDVYREDMTSGTSLELTASLIGVLLGSFALFALLMAEIRRSRALLETVAKSERDLAEKTALLETTFETMSQGISVLDSDHNLAAFNPKYQELWQFPPGFLRIGMSWDEVARFRAERGDFGTGDVEDSIYQRAQALERLETLRNEITLPDGKVLDLIAQPMPDGGYVSSHTDITRIKHHESILKEAKEDAEKANRAKSEFLSSMSHELRTPMNAILGFAQFLEHNPKEPLTEHQRDSVSQILAGGDLLLKLIDDVLDLSQIESGMFSQEIEATDPADVFEECLAFARALAKERGIDVMDGATNLPFPVVMIDAIRFKQVLLNLLSNAIKYNNKGGTVILKAERTPDGRLRVSVTDTGPGIPVEKQGELFQPFSRLGQEGSDVQGTGIGLTISKKLMENMNGRIGFESTFGSGSTFWIEAPLAEEDAVVLKPASRASADSVETSGGTLLYVEDNPANLRLMKALIELIPGVTMLSAHNGELGLELAVAHRPNVIIMDINLPGINGFDAVDRLRKSDATKDIPVIALTARALPRDKERGLEAGFHSYLTKPIQIGELLTVLEDILPAA